MTSHCAYDDDHHGSRNPGGSKVTKKIEREKILCEINYCR